MSTPPAVPHHLEIPDGSEEDFIQQDAFLIVGIGASAGGLEAAGKLLKHLPVSTGMAFVLVQHLDPRSDSVLAELLAHQTALPVAQATDGIAVEPNNVYVIPPNTAMTIAGGILQLAPRNGGGPHMPIDRFLLSLAAGRKNRAIGVILSGTASDGTIGLKAIKSEGGITFAQDGSAAFTSMPQSAVSAGAVDFVLSPEEIARELAGIAAHTYFGTAAESNLGFEGPAMQRILSLVRAATNVDFAQYKTPTIRRRLGRRLALRRIDDLEKYLETVRREPDELRLLFEDLLINVTEFFREPAAFEALAEKTLQNVMERQGPVEPIRVWVPACSTGQEAYSIAISLVEALDSKRLSLPIQIFGTDVSDRSIEGARQGKYPETIAAVISPERLRRFFIKTENGYQIAAFIRELCVFSRQDLTRDPPLAKMDIVSCRNVLIYFGLVLQRRVLSTFGYALHPGGLLLLGNSETLGPVANYFTPVDADHKIYARNPHVAHTGYELPPRFFGERLRDFPVPPRKQPNTDSSGREADRILLQEYAPDGLIVNSDLHALQFRGDVGRFISPAAGEANLSVTRLVREELGPSVLSAIQESRTSGSPARRNDVQLTGEPAEAINVVVWPLSRTAPEPCFLILFEKPAAVAYKAPETAAETDDLARDLTAIRAYLQSIIEELRSANEEAQSSNEELQSINEELQTAREELQSSNEELTTVNEELRARNSELNQVNNDLLNLLGSMRAPIVMLNSDLRIRRFTPSAEKVLNLIPTDVGRPISDIKPRINVPDLEQLFETVLQSLQPVERDVQGPDGHWYSLRIHPYRTAENRIEGAVLQLLDIDQLRTTLASAEQARDYAEAILATVREPLMVLNKELRVETANKAYFATFRTSAQFTVGKSLYELEKGQWDTPKVQKMLSSVSADVSGNEQDFEIEHQIYGDSTRTFQLNARCVRGAGSSGLILLALVDITDSKRAAEAKYRRLFETAKDAILIADGISGEITDVNPFLVELFGYDRASFIGRCFWDAGPVQELSAGREVLEQIQREEVVRFADVPLKAKDGHIVEVEAIGNIYVEGDQRTIQFNIRDITERKKFESQLQQTAKLESLGVLAGGIAHDFNNLLTGVIGNASLALTEAPPGSLYQASLREVVQAGQRAADLTRQMLAYAGKGRFIIRLVDISETVRDIGALIRGSIPRFVELEFHLAPDLPPVEADPVQMQQLIMNLVINGAEAVAEGKHGRVRITTGIESLDEKAIRAKFPKEELQPGSYVVLDVTDNGSGMDDATKARIFDPFFTTKFSGRGLGLAATAGIVRGHRGAIALSSTLGRGTTFRVLLPASRRPAQQQTEELASGNLRGTGRVLVVDDEETVRRVAVSALEHSGYTVRTASHGQEALAALQEQGGDFALVILDLTMPVMGGEEALPEIRRMYPAIPVILSSGYDQGQAVDRFKNEHLSGFLQKPYTTQKLLEAVHDAIYGTEKG